MIIILLPGEPIAKMRPRFSKKGTYDPQHQQKHAAKFQILSQIKRTNLPYTSTPIEIEMIFSVSVRPDDKNLLDWGVMEHIQKPDIDNLTKFYLDVLNGLVYTDDKQVIKCTASKKYALEPSTEIYIVPKKPSCDDKVKEILALIPPSEISSISAILSCIAEWSAYNENPFHCNDYIDYDEVAYLILDLAEKHADNLKKINKKFPGLAKVLKERIDQK